MENQVLVWNTKAITGLLSSKVLETHQKKSKNGKSSVSLEPKAINGLLSSKVLETHPKKEKLAQNVLL